MSFPPWNEERLARENPRRIADLVGVDDILHFGACLFCDFGERLALLDGVLHPFLRETVGEASRSRRARSRIPGYGVQSGVCLPAEFFQLGGDLLQYLLLRCRLRGLYRAIELGHSIRQLRNGRVGLSGGFVPRLERVRSEEH